MKYSVENFEFVEENTDPSLRFGFQKKAPNFTITAKAPLPAGLRGSLHGATFLQTSILLPKGGTLVGHSIEEVAPQDAFPTTVVSSGPRF